MERLFRLIRKAAIAMIVPLCCFASCDTGSNGDGWDDSMLVSPNPRIKAGSTTQNSFTIEWDAVENASMYMYRIDGSITGRAYTTEKTVSNLTSATTYSVEVMAIADETSGLKNSPWSDAITVTTLSGPGDVEDPDTDLDGYTLVWADEFNGSAVDESVWNIEVNGSGGGNNELQYYTRNNVSISTEPVSGKSCLTLTARKESYGGRNATSGRVNSKGNKYFQYGRFDASIKLPKTANGLWPAYWMMGNDYDSVDWPRCGEIDILEMGHANGIAAGTQDRYLNGACHWGYYEGPSYPNYSNSVTYDYSVQDGEFHLFSCVWDENALAMYIDLDKYPDAKPYFKMNITDTTNDRSTGLYFHKEFFLLFNLAVGGNFPGIWDINQVTALDNGEAKMYIDYVRVYRKN